MKYFWSSGRGRYQAVQEIEPLQRAEPDSQPLPCLSLHLEALCQSVVSGAHKHFNTLLETYLVPACLKTSTIIPIPKKPRTTGLNNYRWVTLTSVLMKSFVGLVLSHFKSITDPHLDPLLFAYRANRFVDHPPAPGLCRSLPLGSCLWISAPPLIPLFWKRKERKDDSMSHNFSQRMVDVIKLLAYSLLLFCTCHSTFSNI